MAADNDKEVGYYTASSVIDVLTNHPALFIDYNDPFMPSPVPSCPKERDPYGHCRDDFPDCEGKTLDCKQQLLVKTKAKEDPYSVNFLYYIDRQTKEGKVKKNNTGLKRIKLVYGLDEAALRDA